MLVQLIATVKAKISPDTAEQARKTSSKAVTQVRGARLRLRLTPLKRRAGKVCRAGLGRCWVTCISPAALPKGKLNCPLSSGKEASYVLQQGAHRS